MGIEIIVWFTCDKCHYDHEMEVDFDTIRAGIEDEHYPEGWIHCKECREDHCPECAEKCQKEEEEEDEDSEPETESCKLCDKVCDKYYGCYVCMVGLCEDCCIKRSIRDTTIFVCNNDKCIHKL
jgi:hypothetical protein